MSDVERTAALKRPRDDDRASEVRNWFQPVPLADSPEADPADPSATEPSATEPSATEPSATEPSAAEASAAEASAAEASAGKASAAEDTPAAHTPADDTGVAPAEDTLAGEATVAGDTPAGKATPAEASSLPAERPATAGQVRDSYTGSGPAKRTETYTEPDTMILPKLRVSPPQAQDGTGRPRTAIGGRSSAEAKTLPPSAPAPSPAGAKRPPSPTGSASNSSTPNNSASNSSASNSSGAAEKPRGYYSGSKPPAWPDALNQAEPETVILPKLFVSRPPGQNSNAARTGASGQRPPAGAKAVRPDVVAEPETMMLPVVQDIPSKSQAGSATGRRSSRKARATSPGADRKPPGTTRRGPGKFIASLGRRLKQGTGRHRPLIVALAAVMAIAAAATLISIRLDTSPRPAGAPPVDIPSPASKGQIVQVATSSTWPTTPPASVPSACQQPTLKGTNGASVLSYLDDKSTQHSLVATEAKGLDLLDFSWTSLASPTDVVRTDSFDPSLTTELTAASQAGPCGLRFATLSDNDPTLSHSADVRMMTQMLTSSSVRQAHVLAVAQWMAKQPLATGLTINYENGLPQNLSDLKTVEQVAGWSGLSLDEAVSRLTSNYTQLIGEIAAAMHRQHRLVRLMAPVRDSDDVDASTTDIAPYLLDYGALAQYVDQIVLQAYNFSYATSNPGAIATFADVAKVLAYVHSYNVPWSKLAVAEPSYAYNWTVNKSGDIAVNAKGQVISATTLNATQVAASKKQWHEEKTENGETEYTYTQNGQQHIVWDGSSALKTEMAWLKRTYAQIGVDVSQIGNADPTGSALAVTALRS